MPYYRLFGFYRISVIGFEIRFGLCHLFRIGQSHSYVGPSIGLIPMIIANVFTDPHRDANCSCLHANHSTSGWK